VLSFPGLEVDVDSALVGLAIAVGILEAGFLGLNLPAWLGGFAD
jgi:hypothetical protein